MADCRKLALLTAAALLAAALRAAPNPVPSASWVPGLDRSISESAEYLTALPTARTFLDSLKAEDCWSWRKQLESDLSALPEDPRPAAAAFKSSLLRLGFEPENIISTDNERRSDPVLQTAVCVRHGHSRTDAPLLVYSSLSPRQAANTAAVFALSRNLQRFRLDPVRPIWFCAGQEKTGLSELLKAPGKSSAKHRQFSTLLRVQGNSAQVFANLMGQARLSVSISSRGLVWAKKDSQENAQEALASIRQTLLAMSSDNPLPNRAAFTDVQISAVACNHDLLSAVRPKCQLTADIRSRDEEAIQTTAESLSAAAQAIINQKSPRNSSRLRMRIRLSGHLPAAAASSRLGAALKAWRASYGAELPADAFLNAGFIGSDALLAAQAGIPALVLSAVEPYPDQQRHSRPLFVVLARTILILCGAKIDSVTVPALSEQQVDFVTDAQSAPSAAPGTGQKISGEQIVLPDISEDLLE